MDCNVLILAGGFGERLWPASTKDSPKQFMTLEGGLSFLQQALERAFFISDAAYNVSNIADVKSFDIPVSKSILLITRLDILDACIDQCKNYANTLEQYQAERFLKKLLVIAEPSKKHTAPPIALACRYLEAQKLKLKPSSVQALEQPLLVLTSDHIISPLSAFLEDVQKAVKQAKNGKIVCFAIPPTEAAVGFGYIEAGIAIDEAVFVVNSFKEKPDAATAQTYLKTGNYWWNSGMFCFLPSVFMAELQTLKPDIAAAFPPCKIGDLPESAYSEGIEKLFNWQYMSKAYNRTGAESADTAIAEKTKKACAVRSSFHWQDIGTWESFADLFVKNPQDSALIECSNCFVYSDLPVILCGAENLIVAVKNGKVLVAKKGYSQLVKQGLINLSGPKPT